MTDIGQWAVIIVAAAVIVPFLYISITSLPTGRYYIPMLPALYAMAGLGLAATARLGDAIERSRPCRSLPPSRRPASRSHSCGASASSTACTDTRTRASRRRSGSPGTWRPAVCSHRRPGTTGCRCDCPASMQTSSSANRFDMVGPDDETKVATIAEQLGRIDYVVESSARIWGTVTRLPNRFPSTINFFDGLDSGALGFERVATFRSGISLGPWQLNDERADESFSVVDHPQVRIWRKVRDVDRDTIVAVARSDRGRERRRHRSDQSERERPAAERHRDRHQRDRSDLRPGIRHRRFERAARDRLVRAVGAAWASPRSRCSPRCCRACRMRDGDWPRSWRSEPWPLRCSSRRPGCTSISTARRSASSRRRSSPRERPARSGVARSCRVCGASGALC